MPETIWHQKTITLPASARGAHLITAEVERALQAELSTLRVGLLHLFAQHTSCALSLNENWDADVRADMLDALDRVAPEGAGYRHSAEGPDDMPVSGDPPYGSGRADDGKIGTCQVGARGRVSVGARQRGQVGARHVAGDLVFGVSAASPCADVGGDDSRREDVSNWIVVISQRRSISK